MGDHKLSWLANRVSDETIKKSLNLLMKLPDQSSLKTIKDLLDNSPIRLMTLVPINMFQAEVKATNSF